MPMKKYALYKLLKQNNNLRNLRHPMFERNKFMKFLGWFMFLYYAALLIFLGVALGLGMGEHGIAAFHYLDGGLPIIIIIVLSFRRHRLRQYVPTACCPSAAVF